jgi:hypothetical protein
MFGNKESQSQWSKPQQQPLKDMKPNGSVFFHKVLSIWVNRAIAFAEVERSFMDTRSSGSKSPQNFEYLEGI